MKKAVRAVSLVVFVSLLLCLFPVGALAKEETLYVNFGDSIAWGRIENEDNFPDYNWEEDSYSGLFATHLGTTRTSYARRGMQTTDVLYMIDDQFKNDVDNGVLHPDSWHTKEYPPYDGTALETIKNNTKNAQYITLCVGVCDYINYPGDVKTQRMEKIENVDEAQTKIKEYFGNGKIDYEAFKALSEILSNYSQKAVVLVQYITDMLNGFADYVEYYPRIVKDLRALNSDGKIILIGTYLPGTALSFLWEDEDSSQVLRLINSLLDNINLVVKETAVKYNCYYVDTMGVETDWHPTVKGHQQICDRIISVLDGDPTYAGNIKVVTAVVSQIKSHIRDMSDRRENKPIKNIVDTVAGVFKAFRKK